MSNQNGGEIFNIYQTWIASGKCPKPFLIAGDMLDKRYEELLDNFIETKCAGVYSSTNLDLGSVFLLLDGEWKAKFAQQEHQWKTELAEREWQKRVKEVQQWVSEHPNFRQDDGALAVIKDFFAQNPNATLTDWDEYTQTHSDNPHIWQKPKSLGIEDVRNKTLPQIQEMKRIHGTEKVQKALDELKAVMLQGQALETWRETREETAARYKKEEAEEKERQRLAAEKAESRMKYAAEAIVDRFQGQNHSESFRVRETLRSILCYKSGSSDVDWQATVAKRAEFVQNYEHKNPAVITNAR